nr:26S protease regulatory subunit 6B homolog [Ipomoea batatas]
MATPMVLDPNPIPKPSLEVLATQTDTSSQDIWNSSRYVKDKLNSLRREHLQAQEELKRIQSVPLVIGQFMEMIDQNNSIVGSTTGSNYYGASQTLCFCDESSECVEKIFESKEVPSWWNQTDF